MSKTPIIKVNKNNNLQECSRYIMKVVLLVMFVLLTLMSCNSDIGDSSSGRKMTGGTIPINIYLYYAPKTLTYTPAGSNKEVTEAFQGGVWAWQCISSGDKNYTTADWPGDFLMTPYNKDGVAFDTTTDNKGVITALNADDPNNVGHKVYESVAYWKFTLKVSTQNDLGILFVDAHTKQKAGEGDQYKWEQTNDIRVPKSKLKKNANLYFIYGKVAYYESYEESQGLKSAVIPDKNGSSIAVTFYNDGTNFTKDNFIVTDRNAILDDDGNITTDAAGNPTGDEITVSSVTDVSSTGLTLNISTANTRMPYKVYYKRVIEETDESGTATQRVIISNPVYAYITSDIIDAANVTYNGDDALGVTFNVDGTKTFRTWAPTADTVSVLLFKSVTDCGTKGANINKWEKVPAEPTDDGCTVIAMERSNITVSGSATSTWDGTWVLENENIPSDYNYYKYRLTFSDKVLTADQKRTLSEIKGADNLKREWVNTIECRRLKGVRGKSIAEKTDPSDAATTVMGEMITFDVADIWARVGSPDGVATQLVSIDDDSTKPVGWEEDYYNPFKKEGVGSRPYSEAVIYEIDIADYGEDCKGKYNIFSTTSLIEHIKDLGITHVALMPVMENTYTMTDTRYNWGFCTYNFNVPESRYAVDMSNGVDSVRQLRSLIQKLHDAGVAVIMDVAFTHTGNNKCTTGSQSLYDAMVPGYFYRMEDGVYSNGTNQGSEIASGRVMVKKYIIDCLKHWMRDYHINGFSFYLMALHEKYTMEEIYNALYELDPNVIIFGEPWTGGRKALISDTDSTTSALPVSGKNGVGGLDDNYRTAIKGKELRGFMKGAIQGDNSADNDKAIAAGLLNKRLDEDNAVDNIGIHYAEIHDDNTLFDKLLLSMSSEAGKGSYKENTVPLFADLYKDLDKYIFDIKAQDKLAAAYVILAQGTPFISAGQEYLRTKNGNPDASEAGRRREYTWIESALVKCNEQDMTRRDIYDDVFSVYRGLIALKKAYPSNFGNNSAATASILSTGVIKYDTGGFIVYFNATDSVRSISEEGYAVDVSGGFSETGYDSFMGHTYSSSIAPYSIASTKTRVTSVGVKSFVIIKK